MLSSLVRNNLDKTLSDVNIKTRANRFMTNAVEKNNDNDIVVSDDIIKDVEAIEIVDSPNEVELEFPLVPVVVLDSPMPFFKSITFKLSNVSFN